MTTDRTPATGADHFVWAEGPLCDPNCPGAWSQYHDGYAWGTEKAQKTSDARVAAARREGWDAAFRAGTELLVGLDDWPGDKWRRFAAEYARLASEDPR